MKNLIGNGLRKRLTSKKKLSKSEKAAEMMKKKKEKKEKEKTCGNCGGIKPEQESPRTRQRRKKKE